MTNPGNFYLHQGDLPQEITFKDSVAIDTETMGLNPHRDRLCLVQLSAGDNTSHLVQLNMNQSYNCPNLIKLLADASVTKIFHFARFDLAVIYKYLGIILRSVYCTKIASKLVRNFTSRHGLKNLCSEILNIELSKQNQMSDWGNMNLSPEQCKYAANDVLYLHQLKEHLDLMLHRENRTALADECFKCLPTIAQLDLLGYENCSLFQHS